MPPPDIHVVVLAAGQGTRMRSSRPKVLHAVTGGPMIEHVLRTADALEPATVTVVVGHGADAVRKHLAGRPGLQIVVQEPQLGTAHALRQAEPVLRELTGTVVLLSGDVPLLTADSVTRLVDAHRQAGAAATVMTATVDDPAGYGRIVRQHGRIARIVEERDATAAERGIREINSGIYAFDLEPLFPSLEAIAAGNAQGEYYLTDLIGIYREREMPLETLLVDDAAEIRGVNSRRELADVSRLLRQRTNEALMASGVTLVDPETTYIDPGVQIGEDSVIHPGAMVEGRSRIGAGCVIEACVRIVDSEVADAATVRNFSVLTGARVGPGAVVGPFAHLRPDAVVGDGAKVGNFVELKKTTLGAGSKASHLSYLGDATIGANVNVGAGTITCNYDGERKHATIVEDGAFIGSDSQLIAPVRVGAGAYVAAGSSITDDVPAGSLGIARGRQTNVEGWVKRRKDT